MVCNMDCFNCQFDDCVNDMSPNAVKCMTYYYSEKGIANREKNKKKRAKQMKKYQKKYIKSGKNAEACKRYYQRKKARMLDTV